MLSVQDRIVLTEPQLHGGISNLLDGQIISIEGSNGTVAIDGELVPRVVPMSQLTAQEDAYGVDYSGRPNEMPVENAIRS